MQYLIGLGTNLNDRLSNLSQAVKKLKFLTNLKNLKISSVYQTKALLLEGSPPEWDIDYLNIVISGYIDIPPEEVLKIGKSIEKDLGRDFSAPRWSPRLIDIDILLSGDNILSTETLSIPHSQMLYRSFVLVPACEIAPKLIHPNTNTTLEEHLNELPETALKEIIKTNLVLET